MNKLSQSHNEKKSSGWTTQNTMTAILGALLLMPIAGYFLYRRGYRMTGGILIGFFLVWLSINAVNRLEIGAKK